ncbi:hypothetical protein DEO72_LG5g2517 [Vigna unguiculata]|uniref:Uncharacterized protein n=1 Tax=Vigna unguiculata TaxID=3917 RepID=A0A4D6M0Z0_VIGUN|nr:hypothetical protein DEO72_LG5g2517 [Vigna unguiculata]
MKMVEMRAVAYVQQAWSMLTRVRPTYNDGFDHNHRYFILFNEACLSKTLQVKPRFIHSLHSFNY